MRKFILSLIFVAVLPAARAQFGGLGDKPVEITSGNTRFEEGVAIAEDNVQIHYGKYDIYCDYAEYNPDTRDALLIGNVRVYTPDQLLTGQRALFNMETKQMRALELSGSKSPMLFRSFGFRGLSQKEFRLADAEFTTDDRSKPDFHLKARTIRVNTDKNVIFLNTTAYMGTTPIFWLPFIYANIENNGIIFLPGYDSRWGAYLLTGYQFPLVNGVVATAKADWRSKFGPSIGLDANFLYGKDNRSYGKLVSDYVFETKQVTSVSAPGEPPETRTTNRYRLAFQQRLFLTDDIYVNANFNVLSDQDYLQDFNPTEFRNNPQPDNTIALAKWNEDYELNLIGRWQINDFQDVTERLPELVADFKQQLFFGLPINYDGETGVASLRRAFSNSPSVGETNFPDYGASRFDTFHQWSLPQTFFGWLTINPKVGIRGTYYSQSGSFELPPTGQPVLDPVSGQMIIANTKPTSNPLNEPSAILHSAGGVFRPVANYGVEVSTKVSRAFEQVQARWLGLDGLRHVMEPYLNYSGVYNAGPAPSSILPFDRVVPSTQPLPLNFPQFTAVDSIDTWNIVRAGVRHRLETRRDNATFQWFSWDSFVDLNVLNPYSTTKISNFYNNLTLSPVPWFSLIMQTQVPTVSGGFTEVDSGFRVMPTRDVTFVLGTRYIEGNPYFTNNTQYNFTTYWHINDNWGISIYEQYEAVSKVLQYQRYMVHRDLSSWVCSLGIDARNNAGGNPEYGFVFIMTLKDAPQVTLPAVFSPGVNSSPLSPVGF